MTNDFCPAVQVILEEASIGNSFNSFVNKTGELSLRSPGMFTVHSEMGMFIRH